MDSTLAVTETLYLLRMVSGASSYLAEVDDVPEPYMFYNYKVIFVKLLQIDNEMSFLHNKFFSAR